MTNDSDDYDVGYGKPPKAQQFRPGQSGNPKGRPKGTKNLKTDLVEVLNEKVQVNAGGKTLTVSKQRAMLMRGSELALKGNVRAIELLTKLALQHLEVSEAATSDLPLNKEEEKILDDFFQKRGRASDQETPSS